jgi:RHS repeat-associated protein
VEQGALFAQLGYDNANRRTSLSYSNNTTTSYAYDLASRLTGITHSGPSGVIEALTYQYDAAGNRVSLTRGNGTASLLPNAVASATYDAANEQTAFAGATLTYDNNGNLTNDGVNTYQWDARNRLVGISGGTTATFAYDALGRRTNKVIGSLTSQFLYDGNDIAAEIGGSAVGAQYLRSLSIDEPFVRQTGNGTESYHTDALGSSLVLSNAQGAPGTTYNYEPFGKTTITGTSVNGFQYTGRENDGSGLYYYRARYYQPRLQRFIAEDPIGFLGGDVNLYGYVGQNPVLMTDPSGQTPVLGCALGALLGAAGGYVYVVDTTLGKKKPDQLAGVLTGAALGCVAGLFPLQGLPGVILGGGLGAYVGAATTLAQSHGDPNNLANNMIQSMITNGISGAIGGGVFGLPGAVLGACPSNA